MIKRLVLMAVILALLFAPSMASAGIIGNVSLTMSASTPYGYARFPSGASGNYYLDYDARLNGSGTLLEIFCVEDATGVSGTTNPYTLLSIDSTLSTFTGNWQRYLAAAYIAESWSAGTVSEATKAAAQIAVWEVMFDGTSSPNLSGGTFTSTAYVSEAAAILSTLPIPSGFLASTRWALAVNPEIAAGGTSFTEGLKYQNYLVPVPIPPTVLLLGAGVLGMIGFRRKFGK